MDQKHFESFLFSIAMGIVSMLLLSHVFSPKSYRKSYKMISAYSAETSQIVNRHLQQTATVVSLEQARIARENEQAPQVGQVIEPGAPKARFTYRVDHSPDKFEGQATQDIRKVGEKNYKLPNQVVMRELSDEEQLRFYKAIYKERYIQQFIENARRGGYEVQLDANDVVVSVRKIEKKNPYGVDLSQPFSRQAQ